MKELKVGIVGAGGIARKHLNILKSLDNVQIKAIYNRTERTGKALAEEAGCKYYGNYNDFLKSDLDTVWICTINTDHFEPTKKALSSKKHVFLEKPITRSLKEGKELTRMGREAKVKTMVGFPLRFDQYYKRIKEVIDSGRLGRILMVWSARNSFLAQQAVYYRDSKSGDNLDWHFKKELHGGPIFSHASHDYDLLQWYAGDIERVFAYGGKYLNPGDVADGYVAALKFKNGAIGYANAPWIGRVLFSHFGVFGDRGTVIYENDRLTIQDGNNPEEMIKFDNYDYLRNEDMYFLDCIRNDEEPSVSFEDGLKSLYVSTAALKSLDEGREVTIEELV
jgi:predicted dehydrogenase